MKKIWARIGVTVEVTDEHYNNLLKAASYKAEDGVTRIAELTLSQSETGFFFHYGKPDGDSYIPAEVFEDIERKTQNE